jgi:hypothetical protein
MAVRNTTIDTRRSEAEGPAGARTGALGFPLPEAATKAQSRHLSKSLIVHTGPDAVSAISGTDAKPRFGEHPVAGASRQHSRWRMPEK